MNEPWNSYRFDYLEREKINEVEDWMVDHEDEIAYRIVFLETQLEIQSEFRRIRNKAACINCKNYRECGIGEEMRHSEREYEFNCCDWVGGRE